MFSYGEKKSCLDRSLIGPDAQFWHRYDGTKIELDRKCPNIYLKCIRRNTPFEHLLREQKTDHIRTSFISCSLIIGDDNGRVLVGHWYDRP